MPRVGEILLEHGWVDATSLQRAIAEQKHAGKRLCSMLIARGLLDPDHASMALAEQHHVAAVLQRHLEHRERALTKLLPPSLARSWYALPIGRMRNGELIVCVRDPRPELHAAIAQTIGGTVVLAVAPAHQLEALIDQTYELIAGDDFEVDMNTNTANIVGVDVDLNTGPIVTPEVSAFENMTLVGLDDARVARDPTQSGQFSALPGGGAVRAPITLPPAVRPRSASTQPEAANAQAHASAAPAPIALAASAPATLAPTQPVQVAPAQPLPFAPAPPPPVAPAQALPLEPSEPQADEAAQPPPAAPARPPPRPIPLASTIAALSTASTRDAATDVAMRFAAGRWKAALLLTVKEGAALGHRGLGAQLSADAVQAVAVPLASPSIVRIAHDSRRLATTIPSGAIQDRLARLLGQPGQPAAAPVLVGPHIACVFVVGDPHDGAPDHGADLEGLVAALGQAYVRVVREKKS